MRKIVDIRPVGIAPHLHLIADVLESGAILPHSVEIDEVTEDELTAYAVTDEPAWMIEAEARAADAEDERRTLEDARL